MKRLKYVILLMSLFVALSVSMTDKATATEAEIWDFQVYYVNYKGANATVKNDKVQDLVGNYNEEKQNLKYQLQFENSVGYEPGDVVITVPRALYVDRHGNNVNPKDIGVPMTPALGKASPFNYTIETVDGVEYLVFINAKEIRAGSDNAIQILYELDDMATIDGTTWEICPEISIRGEAQNNADMIRGSMDTSTELRETTKKAYFRGGQTTILNCIPKDKLPCGLPQKQLRLKTLKIITTCCGKPDWMERQISRGA